MADRRIGFNLDFKANTKDVESNLSKLKKSLQDLQNIKFGDFKGSNDELRQIKRTASQVQGILERSFNTSLNATNIVEFRNQLDKTGLSMKDIQASFAQAGPIGQRAFSQLTSSLLTTNLQLKETHSLIDSMGKTMMNTVKWGIASSIMNSFTQSVQGAFSYVQSLQKSLTNIRIVTGDNTQQMAKFADQANRAAQELGRSTLDYTKSSLTFYQQGLDDETVQARTEATLKAQNITGTGAQMADYLTSVWNGYKVANEQAQLYVDKLAAVADSSASDMSQLAIAMSKVSATANILGVDVDQLAAQIATVVATTRQAPESVGTAFKTIYARLNDIKTGSDQAEISLGNYSGKMASLGINVLDATGHLRDTGEVMDEIGQKWATMTREQQIYLAQTMGGQRQITQVTALFDNWATYSELLNTSLQSQGTLNEKNARYMESLGAKMEQLGAAGERVKAALIDEDTVKGGVQALTNLTNLTASFIESIGGGNNALLALGSIATQVFSGVISKEISSLITNFQNAKYNAEALNAEIALTKTIRESGQESAGGQYVAKQMAEFQKYYSVLDQASINRQKNLIDERGQIENQIGAIRQARQAVSKVFAGIKEDDWALGGSSEKLGEINAKLDDISSSAQTLKTSLNQTFKNNTFKIGDSFDNFQEDFKNFLTDYSALDDTKARELDKAFSDLQTKVITPAQFIKLLNTALDEATQKSKEFGSTIDQSETKLRKLNNTAQAIDANIEHNKNNFEQLFDVNQVTKLIGSLGQVVVVLNNISNFGRIIKDEDLSTGEKLRQILTNAAFTIPTLVSSVKTIATVLGMNIPIEERSYQIQKKKNLELEKEGLIRSKNAALEELQNLRKLRRNQKGNLSDEDFNRLKELRDQILPGLNNKISETDGAIKKSLAQIPTLGKAIKASFAKAGESFAKAGESIGKLAGALAPAVPYIVAIGSIVAAGYILSKVYNSAADAAKSASESAVQAKERYDALRDSFKNLMSSIEDYSNAKSALDDLVEGTSEWYDQVNLLNDKVLQLLQTFPELAKYVHLGENGVLTIDEEGIEEGQKIYRQRAYAAGMANAVQQERSYQANKTAQITEEGRRIYGIGGMLGGYGTLEKVLNAVESQGQGILEDENFLRDNLKLNEDQITATLENIDSIRQLSNALKSEEIQVNALKDSVIKSTLAAEKQYQQANNKQVFSDLYASAMEQASTQLDNKYYTETLQGDQGGLYTVRELDKKALAAAYSNYSGRQARVDSSGKFQEKIGNQWKEITTENVQNYVAAAEANAHATELLTEATERYNQAEEKLSEEEKQILFNNNFARGLDKVDIRNLTSQDIETLKNSSNTEEIANFLGVDPSKFNEELDKLNEQIQNGLTGFINNIQEDSIKQTLEKIHSEGGLSQAIAEQIAQDIKSTQTKVSKEAGQVVSDFYDKIFDKDNLESGTNFISTFDFAIGSLTDFKNGLSKAGIDVEKFADEIEEYYNAQIKRRNIEFQQNRVNPEKVANGSATMGLLQKQASGDNLSKQEIEDLNKGIEGLLQLYPELRKEINILSKSQLSSTDLYQQSLRRLKNAFISSYQDMLTAGTITQEEINGQISNYIKSSEDLQAVKNAQIITYTNYSEKLIQIASNYSNCAGELNKYATALEGIDPKKKEAAQFDLRLAVISAENAQAFGIEADRIEALSQHYVQLAKDGVEGYQGLDKNAQLAVDAATRYLRLNDAIEDLQKNYTKITQLTQAYSVAQGELGEILGDSDFAKTFSQIKKDIADIVGTSEDLLGDDWITENLNKITQAANGNTEAINALREAAQEEIFESLSQRGVEVPASLNLDKYQTDKETFLQDLNELEDGADLLAEMSLDDLAYLQTLVTAMQQAGMAQSEIEAALSGIGINIDLAPFAGSVNEAIDMAYDAGNAITEGITPEGFDTEQVSSTQTDNDTFQIPEYTTSVGHIQGSGSVTVPQAFNVLGGSVQWLPLSLDQPYPILDTVNREQEATKETTATALKVIGAHKISGGKISHKNASGGNKKSSGGKKGGGGGKGSQPKTPKTAKGVTTKIDPYRTVNNALKRTGSDLEKVRKEQEKLAGKDLIDNLTKQQKILDEQVDLQKEKLAIAKQERDTIASTINQQLAGTGMQLQFDQNGTIQNMQQVMQAAARKANDEIARYNRMSAEQQEKDANKNIAKNAETWFKNIQTLLSNYDKLTEDTIPKLEQDIQDQLEKQLELNLQKFNLQVDLTLDAGQAKRQYDQFKKQVIDKIADDDILGIDRYLQEDIKLYQAENQALDKHIEEIRERISNMQNGLFDSVYGNNINQAFEDLAKYTDKAVDNLKDIEDKIKDIRESVFDAIDKVEQAFDEQKEEYDYISDLIDHSRKLTEIKYGDDAYDLMEQLYERERENNNSLLEFQYGQTQLWYQKMLEARQNMNNATDEQDRKHWEKQFKEYEKLYIDSQNELNSKFEESIENIIDKYVNAINKVFDELEKRMTNGLGLGYLADEWDLINEGTDRYLDKVDALYEIDTLDNAYQEAIKNAEGNPQAQKSLNELMNTQLKYLRDKDKLTKYDVDRANALLDIEVKRLALENSRNNKSKLRLRRDSQGNYTYQYTADDSDVNKAEQDLAKARKDLYDMTRDSYKDNLEDFQSTLTQMENDIKDVMADATLSEEQRWKKAKMLAQNYAPQIKDILSNLEVTKGFLPSDMVDSLSASLHEAIQLSDDDAETLLHTIVPQMTSTLADAAKYVRDQGIEGLVNDMFEGYNLASEQLRKEMEQAERYVNQDLSELIKQTDAAILVAKDLLENNAKLIADNQDFINRVNQQIAQGVQEAMTATNTSLADTTLSALDAATAFDRLNASLQAAIMTLDPDYYNININKASSRDVNNVNKSVNDTLNNGMEIASGATGMYTGSWGSEGRLAILHEKELLLNKDDTKNMLSAINIVRTMDDLLNNIDFNNKILNSSIAIGSGANQSSAVDQNIHIEANFPNVSMRVEIEKAFEGLVNQAYQYAFNTKK